VVIASVVAGIEPVPIPGVIIPGTITGREVPGAVPIEIRVSVPISPSVVIPRLVIPRSVVPGPVVPRSVPTPGIVVVTQVPRPESPGIVPGPGRGIPNRYGIVFKRETDVFACRNNQGVSGAKDISLGGMGIGQQIVQFFIGWGRLLGHNGRTGVNTVVKSLALKTACGRA
jgi:hypothetical protein